MAVLRRHKAGLGAVLSKVQVRDMSWYFQATSCPQGGPLPVGRLWPGTIPMESPSRATYDKLQADPALVERDAEALAEFEAAPWLLPTRSKVLPYAGVHDLERLLKLRSTAIGPYNKTITVVLFSKNASVMAQNAIYSMVKFGGVRNFIVGTWSQEGLDVCADLNLPCADVAAHLPEPLENPSSGEFYSGHDYLVVKWLRRTLVLHLLQQGYAVLYVDADVSWVMKPLWESHIKFVDEYGADGAAAPPRAAPAKF
ncbi:hypothetical protein CHLNCDRAFT_141733 [Chlorella variabilis]|uniref:Nucleotide-diphospho-sugar transferase domain-containing protein n=1 Tax=Chlorella variabilis TaxID=554065 RepID=E1ZTH4_CHLVA|nr:hypothetical protein CHLNCDRAFT_141733 [Chlorella variabilis]EFN50932.1 hypothetical protein CHLNCDRAFT_141733 [Chlorella variabilis]|eukprot:XP_005843034.1 hypothetical protein CHLNCDRAFT_141733 [Chlorella variabilis]